MTTFFFYDLETTGFNPRESRIVQFAGRRTDLSLQEIGKPYNYLIKLTDDVVPDPDAVLITGITPQKTLAEGITEVEFLKIFHEEIAIPDTIFVGYNTIRFDDEFMRFLHYRNFYDPYEWQWQDGRSRWDLLDVVRTVRALRPDGINWPVDNFGKATNRLELLTKLNHIEHNNAHDALNDVNAVIELAKLINSHQPKLFHYLLKMRDKKEIAKLVLDGTPFVYVSGKYDGNNEKTTVVVVLAEHPKRQAVLVYDLRYDPTPFIDLTTEELVQAWRKRADEPGFRLPVKTLQFNRCPAVAPLSVLEESSQHRIHLSPATYTKNYQILKAVQDLLRDRVLEALQVLDDTQQDRFLKEEVDVDMQLYEGFFNANDKIKMSVVRATDKSELNTLDVTFEDDRLRSLLPLYKARNYPILLTEEERNVWEQFRERKLLGGKLASRMSRYFTRIDQLEADPNITGKTRFLLDELKLYGESIMPVETGF